MARGSKGKSLDDQPSFGRKDNRPRAMLGLIFLVAALLCGISIWDYDWTQNPGLTTEVTGQNKVGNVGLAIASNAFRLLGVAAWLIPILSLWLSLMLFLGHARKLRFSRYVSMLAIFVCAPVLLSLWQVSGLVSAGVLEVDAAAVGDNTYPNGIGGWVGDELYRGYLHASLGQLGTLVVFGIFLIASIIFLFYDNVGRTVEGLGSKIARWNRSRADAAAKRKAEKQKERALKAAKAAQAKAAAADAAQAARQQAKAEKRVAPAPAAPVPAGAPPAGGLLARFNKLGQGGVEPTSPRHPALAPAPDSAGEAEASKGAEPAPKPEKRSKDFLKIGRKGTTPSPLPEELPEEVVEPVAPPAPVEEPAASGGSLKIIASEQTRKATVMQPEKRGDYVFPALGLLREPEEQQVAESESSHQMVADLLVRTLGEFGVKVTMGEVHTGPVITRYDVYPAAGVRVEKIQNLDKNLALSLKALSVRILAPVPGKGCVGIEIPNKNPQSVCIRDILESENWVSSKAEIPIALGKEVSGKPLVADLTKMPHLLIAGSTGSGKTVCINSVITSLLYKLSPEDLRFVMVDPKIVEMQVYNALPHMLIPVVTDPKKVPGALKYLLNEMERRYQMFAKLGVRNIAGFNAKRSRDKDAEAKARELELELSPEERAAAAHAASMSVPRDPDLFDEDLPEKFPYIVCIVDELADLMMVAPADIETGIARLAQLARAAGIHLILATQRPSVNVITGVIKANLPSRIAFKVASKVDSRTILDGGGADQLIGRGDMLFLPPGSPDLIRSQGAFVSDEEITTIVEYISKTNGEPVFDELFQRSVEEGLDPSELSGGEEEDDLDGDALIPDALEVIRTSKRASTSMLQRRLRIGYNRAARIMELLEERGYVGPENGSQPREILRDLD